MYTAYACAWRGQPPTWRQGIWVWSEVFVCKAGDEVRFGGDLEMENLGQESLGIQLVSMYSVQFLCIHCILI